MRVLVVASLCCLMPIGPFVACKSDSCDPGFLKQDNICVPQTTDAGVVAEAGPNDGDADVGDADVADAASETPFGRPCTHGGDASSDCESPAPYCAIQPGTDSGYCTALNCTADPSICPAGWSCFALPSLNFCFKP